MEEIRIVQVRRKIPEKYSLIDDDLIGDNNNMVEKKREIKRQLKIRKFQQKKIVEGKKQL